MLLITIMGWFILFSFDCRHLDFYTLRICDVLLQRYALSLSVRFGFFWSRLILKASPAAMCHKVLNMEQLPALKLPCFKSWFSFCYNFVNNFCCCVWKGFVFMSIRYYCCWPAQILRQYWFCRWCLLSLLLYIIWTSMTSDHVHTGIQKTCYQQH